MKIYISMPDNQKYNTFTTPRALARLQEVGEVSRNRTDRELTVDELVEQAQDADVIMCGWGTVKFTKKVTDRLPNLKIIAYTAGSMVRVVDEEVLQNGIVALTGNYIFAKSVAEGCIAYILCALRRLEKYMKVMRNGGWKTDEHTNYSLLERKIGLVGFGEIAKYLVDMLKPFDVEILVNSGHMTDAEEKKYGVKKASREEIFSTCDIVSLHLALTEKTVGCIDRTLLSMLKPGALFVNTARGKIVDEDALVELLEEKRFCAALDVFAQEPPAENSPLRNMENVVLLPHMGGPTTDRREAVVLSFAEDLERFKQKEPMKNLFEATALSHMTNEHA